MQPLCCIYLFIFSNILLISPLHSISFFGSDLSDSYLKITELANKKTRNERTQHRKEWDENQDKAKCSIWKMKLFCAPSEKMVFFTKECSIVNEMLVQKTLTTYFFYSLLLLFTLYLVIDFDVSERARMFIHLHKLSCLQKPFKCMKWKWEKELRAWKTVEIDLKKNQKRKRKYRGLCVSVRNSKMKILKFCSLWNEKKTSKEQTIT